MSKARGVVSFFGSHFFAVVGAFTGGILGSFAGPKAAQVAAGAGAGAGMVIDKNCKQQ